MSRLSLVLSISSPLSSMHFQSFRTVSTTYSMDNESLIDVERIVDVERAKRLYPHDDWLWRKHQAKWSSMTRLQAAPCTHPGWVRAWGLCNYAQSNSLAEGQQESRWGCPKAQVQVRLWNRTHGGIPRPSSELTARPTLRTGVSYLVAPCERALPPLFTC